MALWFLALLPFLGAIAAALLGRAGRTATAWGAASATALALAGVVVAAPGVMAGRTLVSHLPIAGGITLRLDGLGLLFAGLILGVGLLVIAYSRAYLSRQDSLARFLSTLMLFQGAMLGIVLAGDIVALLLAWELTSLTSFLLIGFWGERAEAQRGARLALAITGAGGLALIGGLLLLAQAAGTTDLAGIVAARQTVLASPLALPALMLVVLGAATKSALVPFHLWLPQAMAAPTPVSAYLHSATMVKAGLFLLLRLSPVWAGTPGWTWTVATLGLVTMVWGAWLALRQDDLKALLAQSTVSHLGLIAFLIGLGTEESRTAAIAHIIMHATFKAALFLGTGIVDHETGTRSLARLGGLWGRAPVTGWLLALAAASMAGVPLFAGFISKELLLEEAVRRGPWLAAAVALGAVLSVAYTARFASGVLLGAPRSDDAAGAHDPGPGMLWPVGVLVALTVVLGLRPGLADPLLGAAVRAAGASESEPYLVIWHGVTAALGLSLAALVLGAVAGWWRGASPEPRAWARDIAEAVLDGLRGIGAGVAAGTNRASMARIAGAVVVVAGLMAWLGLAAATWDAPTRPGLPAPLVGWIALAGLAAAVVTTVVTVSRTDGSRFLALVMVGLAGLVVVLAFAHLSAPDLALTQLAIEVATVILMMLTLNLLPRRDPAPPGGAGGIARGALALAAGGAAAALTWAMLMRAPSEPSIAGYHLANSYELGGGKNVVNVILVDFRGYDTWGEVIVLGIAGLVIFAVAETLLSGRMGRRLAALEPQTRRAGDPHPLMLIAVTRVLMPVVVLVAAYMFWRGHNAPGGGFVAGLLASLAIVMQAMASGFQWSLERQRTDSHALIAVGTMIAGLAGWGAWLWGEPFLRSNYAYVRLPPFGEVEIATALIFDLGVMLAVVGAVLMTLASLSRLAVRARMGDAPGQPTESG